ncbi:hypothetical protein ME121_3522 [Methylobacterium sp. ME121]|nr:hypothetical protein ME121_3522 [Methylobacterium sp. ME121]
MPIAAHCPKPPALLLAAALGCAASAAAAHPHVWVTAKAQLVYEGGKLVGVRDTWSFDPEYTAFVTQGLDTDKDGKLSPEELAGLAAENTANLAEFGYFTKLKVGGKDQAFGDPKEPAAHMDDRALVMTFLLPLKTPVQQGRGSPRWRSTTRPTSSPSRSPRAPTPRPSRGRPRAAPPRSPGRRPSSRRRPMPGRRA